MITPSLRLTLFSLVVLGLSIGGHAAETPSASVPARSALDSLSPADRPRMETSGVRLWDGAAPQSRGTTQADIPMLYPVLPAGRTSPVGAVIVFPGGGYTYHAAHESFPIAEHFRAAGLAAFVVTYRLRPYDPSISLLDAQRAVRVVRARAGEFGVDPKHIAVIGFSAGGHLAANLSNHGDDGLSDAADPVERQSSRIQSALLIYPAVLFARVDRSTPAARALPTVLGYPGLHRDITAQTPPTFLVVGYDDDRTPYEHCLAYGAKLHEAGVKFELHVLGVGGHGFALRVEDPRIRIWGQLATNWLATCGFNVEPN